MLLGGGALGEPSGALQYQLDAEVLPGKFLRLLDGRHLERFAVHHEAVAFDLDRAREAPVHRVVLEQVGERLGIGDVVDGDELEVALIPEDGRAQHVAPDATEPVDAHTHGHDGSSR